MAIGDFDVLECNEAMGSIVPMWTREFGSANRLPCVPAARKPVAEELGQPTSQFGRGLCVGGVVGHPLVWELTEVRSAVVDKEQLRRLRRMQPGHDGRPQRGAGHSIWSDGPSPHCVRLPVPTG